MAFATIDVTKGISGTIAEANLPTIPVTKGGTGLASGTTGQFLKFTGSTTLAPAEAGGGKVGQVVETNYTTYASNATNSFNTNMARTITPSSTNSKIYVSVTAQMSKEAANTKVIGRIFRVVGGSVVATRVCTDNQFWDGGTYGKRQSTMGIQWLDSPSTTSEITYQYAFASYDNATQVHINNYNAGGSYASQITCWEILA